jgi:hypothetical protein
MTDIVVTVPRDRWSEWCQEGDLPGESWSGDEYGFTIGGRAPLITRGERVYIVALGMLRGYAPLVRIGSEGLPPGRWELVRHGGAVAVTLGQTIRGFRGWRYRWWEYDEERPYEFSAEAFGLT